MMLDKYKMQDGIEISLTRDIVQNPKAVVLIVHGLAEHSKRYDYVASQLNSYGYSVYRFDNRGHGKSGGEKVFIDDYNRFICDVDEIVGLIKKENDEPLFILGHSMGGMIATLYGIKHKSKVDGIILSAAVTADEAGLISSNCNLKPHDMIHNELSHLICSLPDVITEYDNDSLVAKQISGSMFIECNKAIEYIKENSHEFMYPTLILHGSDDKIVYPKDSRVLFDNICSKYKKLKIYQGMYHEILNDTAKDEVLMDINNWIRKEVKYINKEKLAKNI